jgi:hypothetical protein
MSNLYLSIPGTFEGDETEVKANDTKPQGQNEPTALSIASGHIAVNEKTTGPSYRIKALAVSPYEVGFGGSETNGTASIWAGNSLEALKIDKDGNVGIGTQEPGAKLDVNGFTQSLGICVNNGSNTGVGRGVNLWSAGDSNHVIYSANPSGTSPANNKAVEGFFNNSHRLRLRTAKNQGFLFENHEETALVDIDSTNGNLWTKGDVYEGGIPLSKKYMSGLNPGEVAKIHLDEIVKNELVPKGEDHNHSGGDGVYCHRQAERSMVI